MPGGTGADGAGGIAVGVVGAAVWEEELGDALDDR